MNEEVKSFSQENYLAEIVVLNNELHVPSIFMYKMITLLFQQLRN